MRIHRQFELGIGFQQLNKSKSNENGTHDVKNNTNAQLIDDYSSLPNPHVFTGIESGPLIE